MDFTSKTKCGYKNIIEDLRNNKDSIDKSVKEILEFLFILLGKEFTKEELKKRKPLIRL